MPSFIGVGAGKLWGVRRIFARISPNLSEEFLCDFCLQILSREDYEDPYLEVTPNIRASFFEVKQRCAPSLPGLSEILPWFSGILPGFPTNQKFWRCTCTPFIPTSTTAVVSWVSTNSVNFFGYNYLKTFFTTCPFNGVGKTVISVFLLCLETKYRLQKVKSKRIFQVEKVLTRLFKFWISSC